MKIRQHFAVSLLSLSAFSFSPVVSALGPADTAPNVTLEEVNALFGDRLETNEPHLKKLLLAIGMERTNPAGQFKDQHVGIPYIVDASPEHWAGRLANGNKDIDTLVNSALLLLFADSGIDHPERAAANLLNQAAVKGYWPASTYMAKQYMDALSDPLILAPLSLEAKKLKLAEYAQELMSHLNQCASAGFAPCQYEVGFWLSQSAEHAADGLNVLREAVRTTISDSRYAGYVDESFFEAVNYIYDRGAEFGLPDLAREQYLSLLDKFGSGQNAFQW